MNFENFCTVLARIESDPASWDQTSFYGTCFVGIAADMAGCAATDEPHDRHNSGAAFLGVQIPCQDFGSARLTLDDFRRMRYVEGTRRFHAAAAA